MDRFERIAGRVRLAVLAERVAASEWEPPEGRRKTWRRELPDGTYEYSETPPEGRGPGGKDEGGGTEVRQEKPEDRGKGKKPEAPKHRPNRVHLGKKELTEVLTKGHWSILSAGQNPNDPKEKGMDPDDPFFHDRHEKLKDALEDKGLRYTEVVGHYSGRESSFMVFHDGTELKPKGQKSVMVHHADKEAMEKRMALLDGLGTRFNQDSVLHGSAGKNEIAFTTGKNKGQRCGGKGWNEAPEAKNNYTEMELKGKEHTKFQVDIAECFKKGLM